MGVAITVWKRPLPIFGMKIDVAGFGQKKDRSPPEEAPASLWVVYDDVQAGMNAPA